MSIVEHHRVAELCSPHLFYIGEGVGSQRQQQQRTLGSFSRCPVAAGVPKMCRMQNSPVTLAVRKQHLDPLPPPPPPSKELSPSPLADISWVLRDLLAKQDVHMHN